ncbi:MAG: T9SS type A sorting domain-containing protein [Candidatus Amulumruptor caecigallinarius]|nr:T9SS type A sorting domain-containing protein [Candidatus Amulumruptor caecigallinarius]MCM1396444.1 T9SS type A sorting domain-containing protein [Candidatus Amulumruptor caecigallinarius]MCM1453499.1 T9SS type A sorting domain-containing protein [bacterium]
MFNSDETAIASVEFADPASSDVFTLNATTAPKVVGWKGSDWGGGWKGSGEAFTLEGTDPLTYALEFTAGSGNYIDVIDSNSNCYYSTDNNNTLSLNGSVSTFVQGGYEQWDGGNNGKQIHLDNLIEGEKYVLRLTQTADGPVLTLEEPYQLHEAPAVSVKTQDGKGVFTISATLAAGEELYYSLDGGVTSIKIDNRGTVTVSDTSTLTAWVLDANKVKGRERSVKWTKPVEVTNPVTQVELFNNFDGGNGASMKSLTKSSSTGAWSASFAFQSADNSSWDNYYFLKLTYKEGQTKYAYLGGTGLHNITAGTTYTTSTTPALSTSTTKLNGKDGNNNATSAGFGLTGGDGVTEYPLTIELDALQENVVSLKVTEPVVTNQLPTVDWSLESDDVWGGETKKYFYISWNQNDNRVSPEWELEKQSDGTYVIDNFMVIPNGQFRIREIERNGNGNGRHKVTDYGWDDNSKYQIGITNVGLNAGDTNKSGMWSGYATMDADKKLGFRWDVGFSIASLKFNPSTRRLDFSINLDKPSTLNQASKPGIPFLALMGDNVKVPLANGQQANFALRLNDNATNHAYTNAWVQYDADGKLYRYGDLGSNASIYKVGSEGDMASSGTPARGQVMNSTRVPPVNLIQFAQDVDGVRYDLSSRDLTFDYQGVVSTADGDMNGVPVKKSTELTAKIGDTTLNGIPGTNSTTRYAAYTIESVNLNGLFKIFNGYGAHTYGDAVNGLSFFAHWGVGSMSGGNVYLSEDAKDGTFVPLSGGGAKVNQDGSAVRDNKDNGLVGDNESREDNTAGKYINFPERSYVWKATFYYALDEDGYTGDDHHVDAGTSGGFANNGRNYSWVHFNFSNAPATLELQLQGADRGKAIWSINADNDQEATIHNYTVKVYRVDRNGNYPTSKNYPDNCEEDDQTEWPDPDGTDELPMYTLQRGTLTDANVTYVAEGTNSVTVDKLPVGRYIAVMTYEMTENGVKTYHVINSNIIQVINVDVDPAITAAQRINGKAYTFDVVARANINSIYNAYKNAAQSAGQTVNTPDKFVAEMTMPHVAAQGDIYLEQSDGSWEETSYTQNADGTATVSFPEGTFSADATSLYYPRVRVLDYIPEDVVDFTITVKANENFSIAEDKSATATVQIEAPKVKYLGAPMLVGDEKEGYNYVAIQGTGFEMVDAESIHDGNTGGTPDERFNTAARFTTGKLLSIVTGTETVELKDGITAESADIVRLPYVTENGEPVDQKYQVETRTYYVRNEGGASNRENPSEGVTTELMLEKKALNAPRTGLADKKPKLYDKFVEKGFTGFKHDVSTVAEDFVTIVDNYSEAYGGANRIVEDAYIAAQINRPTEGLVWRMPLSEQTMGHHENSLYNPKSHRKSTDGKTAHEKAPGVRFVTEASHLTNLSEGRVWWSVNPSNSVVKEHFKQRYWKDFTGKENDYVAERLGEPEQEYWAGCPEGVDDVPDSYGRKLTYDGGEFDRIDHSNGLYGNRNHHVRKGWQGGEAISPTFFRYMFASKQNSDGSIATLNKVDGTDGSASLNPVFDSESDANTYLEALKEWIDKDEYGKYTGTPAVDTKVTNEDEFAENAFFHPSLSKPYAMMRVCHVNHETWWASAYKTNVAKDWFNAPDLKKKDFETVKADMIKYPTKYYTPVAYDLSYTYPFLNNYDHVAVAVADGKSGKASAPRKSPVALADGESTDVKARSTGLISFDATATPANDIVTGVESVEADAQASAESISISYNRASGIATVSAAADVKAVTVYDMSGKQYGITVSLRGTAATADLSNLGAGVYTLRAVTADAAKTVKVQK